MLTHLYIRILQNLSSIDVVSVAAKAINAFSETKAGPVIAPLYPGQ